MNWSEYFNKKETLENGPAVFANRVAVSVLDGGVKITFLEQTDPTSVSKFRNAVFLSLSDAVELKKLLNRMLAGENKTDVDP